MRWPLWVKLWLAFLVFGLSPVVATMTVAYRASETMRARQARVIRRAAQYIQTTLERSPLDEGKVTVPLTMDRTRPPTEAFATLFDQMVVDFDLPQSAGIALVGPDLKVVVSRTSRVLTGDLQPGRRLNGAYVEQVEPLRTLATGVPVRPVAGVA